MRFLALTQLRRFLYSPPSGLVALTQMIQMDLGTDNNDGNNGASEFSSTSVGGPLGPLAMTSSLCRLFILIERYLYRILSFKVTPDLNI